MVSAGPHLAAALPPFHSHPPALVGFVGAAIVKTEVFTNLGLALGAVFVVVLVVLANPLIAIIVLLNVAFCLLEVVGFMPLWDVTLDGVSVVNLVSHCRCCGTYPLDASRYSAVSLFRCFVCFAVSLFPFGCCRCLQLVCPWITASTLRTPSCTSKAPASSV